MRVLLTGANGFLGRAIARHLIVAGHTLRVLLRSESGELAALGVEQRLGDVASLDTVAEAARGCDAVVHCAGRVDALASIEVLHEANVRGTDCVLAACELAKVPRMVFSSCASVVIGDSALEGVDERQPYPTRWPAPYPETKAIAEQRVLAANGPALGTIALRPHFLWGAGEPHLLPALSEQARRGRLRLFGEPECKIDTCHVDNAAWAHVLALERLEPDAAIAGKAYFVSQGEPVRIDGFVNSLLRAAKLPIETRRLAPALARTLAAGAGTARALRGERGEPLLTPYLLALFSHASWFDIGAARRELGYAPRITTVEGLKRLATNLAGV